MQEFEPVLCVYRAGTWPVQWRSRPCLQYHEPLYVRRGGMCRRMLYGRNRNHPLHHVFWPRVQLLWLQRHLPVLWGWDLWRYRMLCWRHDSSSIKAAILSPTGSAGRRVGIPTSDLIHQGWWKCSLVCDLFVEMLSLLFIFINKTKKLSDLLLYQFVYKEIISEMLGTLKDAPYSILFQQWRNE